MTWARTAINPITLPPNLAVPNCKEKNITEMEHQGKELRVQTELRVKTELRVQN